MPGHLPQPGEFQAVDRCELAALDQENFLTDCFTDDGAERGGFVLVLRVAGRLAGYLMGTESRFRVDVLRVCTAAWYRRRGVARMLMGAAIERAGDRLPRVRALVPESNEDALRLFVACGFRGVNILHGRKANRSPRTGYEIDCGQVVMQRTADRLGGCFGHVPDESRGEAAASWAARTLVGPNDERVDPGWRVGRRERECEGR